MNAQEARELIEEGKVPTRPMTAQLEFAHGYLEHYEQTKDLVEAAVMLHKALSDAGHRKCTASLNFELALAQYRVAIGEKGALK